MITVVRPFSVTGIDGISSITEAAYYPVLAIRCLEHNSPDVLIRDNRGMPLWIPLHLWYIVDDWSK